jgi:glycine cleavage system H lipoate-binding protein
MVAVLAVLAITILVLIDWTLQLILAWRAKRAASSLSSRMAQLQVEEPFTPPPGLFYHQSHSWVFLEPNGCVRVGLDGLIGFLLGRFDDVHLPQSGQRVREGDPLIRFTQGKRDLVMASPVSGTVMDVNRELAPDGSFVSTEPYGVGWVCEIKPESLSQSLKKLLMADRATVWHAQECIRMTEFFQRNGCGDVGLDTVGPRGLAPTGFLLGVDDNVWHEFQSKFLDIRRLRSAGQ